MGDAVNEFEAPAHGRLEMVACDVQGTPQRDTHGMHLRSDD